MCVNDFCLLHVMCSVVFDNRKRLMLCSSVLMIGLRMSKSLFLHMVSNALLMSMPNMVKDSLYFKMRATSHLCV